MVKDESEAVGEMSGNLTDEQFAKIESEWNEFLKKRARKLARFYAIWTAVFSAMLLIVILNALFAILSATGAI